MKNKIITYLSSILILCSFNTAAQFEFEPNNSFSEAYSINFDEVYEAAIFETGDQDFYKIFVPNGAVLELNSLQVPNSLEMRVDIFDCSNELCLLTCLLYTSPSPRDRTRSRMPSSA